MNADKMYRQKHLIKNVTIWCQCLFLVTSVDILFVQQSVLSELYASTELVVHL